MNNYLSFIERFKKYQEISKKYKNTVLYGWSWNDGGGTFFEWIMRYYYEMEFDFVIDDCEISYAKKIYRKNLLEYLPSEDTIIFATKDPSELMHYDGYQEKKNIINVNHELGLKTIGYYEWEEQYAKIDVIDRKTIINIRDLCVDGTDYAVSRGIGMALVSEYLAKKYPGEKILDIGCGKGAAILMLKAYGYDIVDGIEYLEDLSTIAKNNISKLGYNSKIFCCDASMFDLYNNYNLFYFYDPFKGKTFDKVINNIVKSWYEKRRRIIIVYANPWENKIIKKYPEIRFVEWIEGDWFTRMTNIYEIGE